MGLMLLTMEDMLEPLPFILLVPLIVDVQSLAIHEASALLSQDGDITTMPHLVILISQDLVSDTTQEVFSMADVERDQLSQDGDTVTMPYLEIPISQDLE